MKKTSANKRVKLEGKKSYRKLKTYKKKTSEYLPWTLPLVFRNSLKTARFVTLTCSAFGYVSTTFEVNTLTYPLGGTQKPAYHARMFDLYNFATVVGARIKITPVWQPTGTGETTHTLMCYIEDNANPNINYNAHAATKPGAVSKVYNGGAANQNALEMNWSLKKAFGKVGESTERFECTRTTSPTSHQFFCVQVVGTPLKEYTFLIELNQLVNWREINDSNDNI